jgi:probable phosphoglycerate mutase
MSTGLIIIRHGNTFDPGQTPYRVGARTDLPLSSSGREQAIALGKYLKRANLRPKAVFSGELRRTWETANLALGEAELSRPVERLGIFNEVDYGPDEGSTEEELVARIGAEALELWNSSAVVPPGWIFDPRAAVENWRSFAARLEAEHPGGTALVFTSNGIARFAPHLTGDFGKFSREFDIKMSTGAISLFEKNSAEEHWRVIYWNRRPRDSV